MNQSPEQTTAITVHQPSELEVVATRLKKRSLMNAVTLAEEAEAFGLASSQLEDLIALRVESRSNMPKIFELMRDGAQLDEVMNVLKTRALISEAITFESHKDGEPAPFFIKLALLRDFFYRFPKFSWSDRETIVEEISRVYGLMNHDSKWHRYPSDALKAFMEIADINQLTDFDAVFTLIEQSQIETSH